PRLAEIVERSAEVRRLREDGQRRRPAPLIGLGALGHARVGADLADARGTALVLGDHAEARAGHGLRERPVVARRRQLPLERGLGHLRTAALEIVPRGLDDTVEDAHAGASSAVLATKRSSAAAASPPSSAASAARTPSSSES